MTNKEPYFRHFPPGNREPDHHRWLIRWHAELYDRKAERAELRRCGAPNAVLVTAGFRRMLHRYRGLIREDDHRLMGIASLAGSLAHVRENDPRGLFAQQMGRPGKGVGNVAVSPMRFRRLQKSRDWDEFYRNLLRCVMLLRGRVNVLSLAEDVLHWAREQSGYRGKRPWDRLQVRWALDYYLEADKHLNASS